MEGPPLQNFTDLLMIELKSFNSLTLHGTPSKKRKKHTFRQIGEVGGTNKSESAMCIWRLIKMLNEHPPTSDQIYI